MREKNNTETSTWISNTDLMSGLLIIFLFIAILMTQGYNDILNKSDEARATLKNEMTKAFTKDEQKIYFLTDKIQENDEDPLAEAHIQFEDNGATFEVNKAILTPEFEKKLDVVLPKYFEAISHCEKDKIKEIRIEGYTSSEWYDSSVPSNEAYFKNMKLSQDRALAIVAYAFSMPSLIPYHELMKEKLTANGLSSRDLIYKKDANGNTVEDHERSRRIEFRVITDDKKTLENLKKIKEENNVTTNKFSK